MEIRTETTMMHHTGGTKFYEVVRIFNDDGKRFVVVNRWGKMSEAHTGGGQCKIETFGTAGLAGVAAGKKVDDKRKRGYVEVPTPAETALPSSFDGDLARFRLNEHFNSGDTVEMIMLGLAISDVLTGVTNVLSDDVVVEEPEPEIERGEEWASW